VLQNFAKSFLDVADNVDRDSSIVKKSVSKINTLSDSSEASKYLKTLLEDLKMIEKQLLEVECSICIIAIIIASTNLYMMIELPLFFTITILFCCHIVS
jgi:hypothetical protein